MANIPPTGSLVIQTRAGNNIINVLNKPLSPMAVMQGLNAADTICPDNTRKQLRRNPTSIYNCHGRTFLCRRAFLSAIKDPLDKNTDAVLRMILRDDHYADVAIANVLPGDVVLYYTRSGLLEHTGVVAYIPPGETAPDPWVLSKWGMLGEYLHRHRYCPYDCAKFKDARVRFMREGSDAF